MHSAVIKIPNLLTTIILVTRNDTFETAAQLASVDHAKCKQIRG